MTDREVIESTCERPDKRLDISAGQSQKDIRIGEIGGGVLEAPFERIGLHTIPTH